MRRRSPCRERGLKCPCVDFFDFYSESLPVQGAWIEIMQDCSRFVFLILSLPVQGAWIEIVPLVERD